MKKIKDFIENFFICIKILVKHDPINSFLKLGCSISIPIITIFMTYLMKWLLDSLIYMQSEQMIKIQVLLIGYFLFKIVNIIATNIESYAEEMNNDSMEKYIKDLVVTKCTELDISIYDDSETYNEIQYINNNYSSISRMAEGGIEVFSAIVSCIIIYLIGFKRHKLYAIVMLIACIPATISKIKYTKKFYLLGVEQVKDQRKIDYLISLVLDKKYSQEIKKYSMGYKISNKFNAIWKCLILKKKRMLKKSLVLSAIFLVVPEICYFIIMILIINKIINGELTIGDFSLYLGLITQLWGNINRVTYDIDSLIEENGKIFYLKKFLNKTSHIKDGYRNITEIKCITFENVYFKYPFSKEFTLKDFSLTIKAGDNIAIVGENGSGKSTIIKLLLRFYDVTSGVIYINNINIKEYNIIKLRSCIGLYFQNSSNYAFSIKDNIIISRNGNDVDEDIKNAIKISGFDMIINTKKVTINNYVTKIFDENGVEFSGGEEQRLALSRAIYSEAKWFVFDEPSSALDPKNEYEFFENIRKGFENKTIIYISHRLSNISQSDKIILVETGKVVETGTINELVEKKGKFYELYEYQRGLYK